MYLVDIIGKNWEIADILESAYTLIWFFFLFLQNRKYTFVRL